MRTDMECIQCGCLMDTSATALCNHCREQEYMAGVFVKRAKDLVEAYMAHVIVDMRPVHKAFFKLKLYGWALTAVRHWQYDLLGKDEWNVQIGIPALRKEEKADSQKDVRIDWR